MSRVGVTGHQSLPESAISFITARVREILAEQSGPLIGYSSLAAGADQLVAQEILAVGGQLHAIIPSLHYEDAFHGAVEKQYQYLLSAASWTDQLPFPTPSEEAYEAAGKWIAEHCEVLIAVWDGQPARGRGGTADAVAHARALSRDIRIIWPKGTVRD